MVTPHDSPEHRCTWACPDSDPLAGIRELYADAQAGMTLEQLEAKHDHGRADRAAVYRELGVAMEHSIQDPFTGEISVRILLAPGSQPDAPDSAFRRYIRYVTSFFHSRLQKGMTNGQ